MSLIINTATQLITNFFESLQIYVPLQWVTSFLEWCKLENKNLKNSDDIIAHSYQQWLISDLSTFEIPTLPSNLSNEINYILNGNYCLQINKVMDISKPKLQQLNQRFKKHINVYDNDSNYWQMSNVSSRMLQLTFTDGVQTVEAMEFRPIAWLELGIAPGTKIRLIGPVSVRRGRIMLEGHHIKLLGGEVDELKVMNTVENVLMRELKLSSTCDLAKSLGESKVDTGKGETDINLPKLSDNDLEIDEKFLLQVEEAFNTEKTTKCQTNTQSIPDIGQNDQLKYQNLSQEFLLQAKEEYQPKTSKLKPQLDMCETNINDTSVCQNQQVWNVSLSDFEIDNTMLLDAEEDILNEMKDMTKFEVDINKHTTLNNKAEVQIIHTITEVVNIVKVDAIKQAEYLIKGKFERVIEKFTVKNKSVHFVIEVSDESGKITLKVLPDIVCKFAECTFEELLNYKKIVLGKDSVAKDRLYEVLKNIQNKFQALDNVLVIQYDSAQKMFILNNVYD